MLGFRTFMHFWKILLFTKPTVSMAAMDLNSQQQTIEELTAPASFLPNSARWRIRSNNYFNNVNGPELEDLATQQIMRPTIMGKTQVCLWERTCTRVLLTSWRAGAHQSVLLINDDQA
jgi:hypothetical protein